MSGAKRSAQNDETGQRNHRAAHAKYVEHQPDRHLHQCEAPMKDTAEQSQRGRAGMQFLADAVDRNGRNGPECLAQPEGKSQDRQLRQFG
jgi:hypothetical protein